MAKQIYDHIGDGYAGLRKPDPRIAAALLDALGPGESLVNVGAGAGSYEPTDRHVVAVEPSGTMVAQRRDDAAPAVRGFAGALPFPDDSFDAALAILTIHHWPDPALGLREMARVARNRVVVLTWDPDASFWLHEYFPDILTVDRRIMPPLSVYRDVLPSATMRPLPVPADCTDGFLGCHWRRPEAYLDDRVRSGMSTFAVIEGVDEGVAKLRSDLESGAWQEKHGSLMEHESMELGYTLVTSELG
ncbi:MAG: class I SAM-dependent methyltransferase [Acidobacteriota bacterium]